MRSFGEALTAHRETVNRLNVYPVPDGDTGTNMGLTVASVVAELERLGEGADMGSTCKAISHGALMGARGNSGVILCQILRGLASVLSREETADAAALAAGLGEGSTAARAGVMRPVEGTILTVVAAAAEEGTKSAAAGCELIATVERIREAAVKALAATPEMLPVLARAGVVDAGGAGLVLLFDALAHVIDGRPLPDELPLPGDVAERLASPGWRGAGAASAVGASRAVGAAGAAGLLDESATAAIDAAHDAAHDDVSDLRYEVMYFLEAPDEALPAFKQVWAGVGDSIVVVGGEGLWNCHIHTDDIGAAIEAALDVGRPREIRVTDLLEQMEEESWVRSAEPTGGDLLAASEGPPPKTAVVAVGTGDGIRRIFHSLGVHHVVAGGQSMNPSTAQILELVDAVPSDDVIVLPNNKNIYPVAAQVAGLTAKNVRVVETPGIQEGFAALLEYDPESGAEENAGAMVEAARRVVAGEVTRAVRAGECEVGPIAAGDWIGLSRAGIVSVAGSPSAAASGLLEKLLGDGHEIVTLIEGAEASAAETRRITEWLRAHDPSLSIERHHGGQPLYPYLISVE